MSATSRAEMKPRKAYIGVGMEGAIARSYAKQMGKSIEDYRSPARVLAGQLAPGASVLEVAPGPGYLAIELAKLGAFTVVGLDISKTFVAIAAENARMAGVEVAFQLGDAASMPFDADSFDLIACRAAFKNFSQPVGALDEMHRVLKPGGQAVIYDLRPDAAPDGIRDLIRRMELGWLQSRWIKMVFKWMLLRRTHSKESFRNLAAQSRFRSCEIREDPIGLEVALRKGTA